MKIEKIMFVAFIFLSCKTSELIKPEFMKGRVDTSKIRIDGFYSLEDRASHLSSDNLVAFTNEGKVWVTRGGTLGNEPFLCEYYTKHKQYLGYYTIKGDSVYVFTLYPFRENAVIHSGDRMRFANMRGKIDSKNKITDWKVVPPYLPGLTAKERLYNFNRGAFSPHSIVFVKSEAVKCLGDQ